MISNFILEGGNAFNGVHTNSDTTLEDPKKTQHGILRRILEIAHIPFSASLCTLEESFLETDFD